MAVTTQKSVEHTNATADPITTQARPDEMHGRMRIAFFTHDQDGAGDATSSVALFKLPAGRCRILTSLSRVYCNWTTSSATLDLGFDAYTNADGTAVAADSDGLIDGLSVDTVGYFTLEGALAGVKATGGTYTFDSKDGVVIRATSQDTAIASGDDLVGYIVYVVD
tara:strand:- start:31 stop:528 length:498 start_codon:yes stop_codon:yes gene_type:complete